MKGTRDMIAPRSRAPMLALETASVSMVFAHARTGGEALTALDAAPGTDNVAVVTESAWRASAIATLAGLVMLVISERACMIARNTDTATTVLAFARRATVVVTARCHRNPNHANVPFTAFVAACSSAPRSTKHKALVHPMSATPPALRSASPSASPERCLSTSLEELVSRPCLLTRMLGFNLVLR